MITERFRPEDMPDAYRQAKAAGLFEPIAIDSALLCPLPTPASIVPRLSEIQMLQLAIWNEMVLRPRKEILPAKLPVQERPGRFEEYTSRVLASEGFACLDDLCDWMNDTGFTLSERDMRSRGEWIGSVAEILTAIHNFWDALEPLYGSRSFSLESLIEDQIMLRKRRLTKMVPFVYSTDNCSNWLDKFLSRLDERFEIGWTPQYNWRISMGSRSISKFDSAGSVML